MALANTNSLKDDDAGDVQKLRLTGHIAGILTVVALVAVAAYFGALIYVAR